MNLHLLVQQVTDKNNFLTLGDYIHFALSFLEYIEQHKQAVIVSQNETHYRFFQFNQEGQYRVTRPFNSNILYTIDTMEAQCNLFVDVLKQIKENKHLAVIIERELINRVVYTLQQSIGFTLDGLPSGKENTAKKINGDLFERLILLILNLIGTSCSGGKVKIPVKAEGEKNSEMTYQHDLIIKKVEAINEELIVKEDEETSIESQNIKVIGSVKVTSKDRIDKIFIDKYLFSLLSETSIPHIAVFLHDVQRKGKDMRHYGINTTFLAGRFKGYTVKLNPLDGVYYFDPRPNMLNDRFLNRHIKTFDYFICNDIWNFIDR